MTYRVVIVLAVLIAGCGSSSDPPSDSPIDRMVAQHPTFQTIVCDTVDQYGYQAALQAAEKDWADQLTGTGLSAKDALDQIIATCD